MILFISLRNIYLADPKAALLFILVIGVIFFLYHLRVWQKNNWEKFSHQVIQPYESKYFYIQNISFLLALSFGIIALMQPMGYGSYPEELSLRKAAKNPNKVPHALFLAIDASQSMNIKDGKNKESRLETAIDVADSIISELNDGSISLYSFTSEPNEITPLTTDYLFTRLMLKEIHINEGGVPGTHLSPIFNEIHTKISQEPINELKSIVLLSDGDDTDITTSTANELKNIVEKIRKEKGELYIVGLGTRAGGVVPNVQYEGKEVTSSLNEQLLKNLSPNYFEQSVPSKKIGESIMDLIEQKRKQMSKNVFSKNEPNQIFQSDLIKSHYYQFPLSIAILFLAIATFLRQTSKRE